MRESRFRQLANTFKLKKDTAVSFGAVQGRMFREVAFFYFAANLLDMFELTPNLPRVRLVHTFGVDRRGDFNSVIDYRHSVLVIAPEADIDPNATPEQHLAYVKEYIPYQLMGSGECEITREDPRVQRFLQLRDTAHQEWFGIVASIAQTLDLAFGDVSVDHTLV